MQAIFNEISALPLAQMSEEQAMKMVLNLIQVCKQLQVLDATFKMRINEQFWNIQLDDYGTIREYMTNSDDLIDDRYFLYAITDSPYLPDDDIDINIDRFLDGNLVFGGAIVLDADSGIRVAYAFDPKPAPMISFASGVWQNMNFIEVRPRLHPFVKLINLATIQKIYDVHFEEISTHYLEIKTASPTTVRVDAILPNKIITNAYLDYTKIYVERNKGKVLNSGITIKQIKDIGGIVAKVNGWIRHKEYSRINNREVFNHHKSKTIFIAIDTEKGDFEVHNSNKNDNHLGAISFDGAKNEPPKGHKLKFDHND